MRRVYFFGAGKAQGRGDMKELLGGKGAGLAEMTRIGLPVPPGFTITTECCDQYLKSGRKLSAGVRAEVKSNLAHLEKVTIGRYWQGWGEEGRSSKLSIP